MAVGRGEGRGCSGELLNNCLLRLGEVVGRSTQTVVANVLPHNSTWAMMALSRSNSWSLCFKWEFTFCIVQDQWVIVCVCVLKIGSMSYMRGQVGHTHLYGPLSLAEVVVDCGQVAAGGPVQPQDVTHNVVPQREVGVPQLLMEKSVAEKHMLTAHSHMLPHTRSRHTLPHVHSHSRRRHWCGGVQRRTRGADWTLTFL